MEWGRLLVRLAFRQYSKSPPPTAWNAQSRALRCNTCAQDWKRQLGLGTHRELLYSERLRYASTPERYTTPNKNLEGGMGLYYDSQGNFFLLDSNAQKDFDQRKLNEKKYCKPSQMCFMKRSHGNIWSFVCRLSICKQSLAPHPPWTQGHCPL